MLIFLFRRKVKQNIFPFICNYGQITHTNSKHITLTSYKYIFRFDCAVLVKFSQTYSIYIKIYGKCLRFTFEFSMVPPPTTSFSGGLILLEGKIKIDYKTHSYMYIVYVRTYTYIHISNNLIL